VPEAGPRTKRESPHASGERSLLLVFLVVLTHSVVVLTNSVVVLTTSVVVLTNNVVVLIHRTRAGSD